MSTNILFSSPPNYGPPVINTEYAYKCFPVRKFKQGNDDGGAWFVEYQTTQQKQFPKWRKKSRKEKDNKIEFTGSFLTRTHHCENARDICCVNISGKELYPVTDADFSSFENVALVEANDNHLTVESFRTFPNVEELEVQLNYISDITVSHEDFPHLTRLDLSYNSLQENALLNLSKLRNLRTLTARGCGLTCLPPDLARQRRVSHQDDNIEVEKALKKTRFPSLVKLDLSENKLADISTFASLAGLKRLRRLNLSKNQITRVPHFRHFSASTCIPQESTSVVVDNVVSENVGSVRHEVSKATKSPDPKDKQPPEIDTCKANNIHSIEEVQETVASGKNSELLEGIDDAVKSLTSEEYQEETNELLNINFGQELNFGVTGSVAGDDLGLNVSNHLESANNQETENNHLEILDDLITDEIRRPFASLEMLDLSHNKISDEESLLALTGWPVLRELKLWGNPLIASCMGIPPVLHHHLQKMCGIEILRKKPKEENKFVTNIPKSRRIKSDLPPIKRNNLLMIEEAIQQAVKEKEEIKAIKGKQSEAAETAGHERMKSDEMSDPPNQNNIFLTQVEGENFEKEELDGISNDVSSRTESPIEREMRTFEEILHIDDEDDNLELELPATIQGSMNVLKRMLEHPLVFSDNDRSNCVKKGESKPKVMQNKSSKVGKRLIQSDVVDQALERIKLQDNKCEENLSLVLDEYPSNKEMRKNFPDVKGIMKRVQKKYDQVRAESLLPIINTHNELSQLTTRVDKPSNDLILSRMKQHRIGDLYSVSPSNTPRVRFRGHVPK